MAFPGGNYAVSHRTRSPGDGVGAFHVASYRLHFHARVIILKSFEAEIINGYGD